MWLPFVPVSATPDIACCSARRGHRGALGRGLALGLGLAGLALGLASSTAWSAAAVPAELSPDTRAAIIAAMSHSPGFANRFAAEVWLMDMSNRLAARVPDPHRRLALLRDVHAAATDAGLSPQLVLAVIEVESNFQRFAISNAGAQGLMQVMPFWRAELGSADDNLLSRQTNLRYGCAILAGYLAQEHGNSVRALARYNGSLGQTWYPDRVLAALYRNWQVP